MEPTALNSKGANPRTASPEMLRDYILNYKPGVGPITLCKPMNWTYFKVYFLHLGCEVGFELFRVGARLQSSKRALCVRFVQSASDRESSSAVCRRTRCRRNRQRHYSITILPRYPNLLLSRVLFVSSISFSVALHFCVFVTTPTLPQKLTLPPCIELTLFLCFSVALVSCLLFSTSLYIFLVRDL